MKYEKFNSILNTGLFANAKINLLKSIAESPQRYVGLFRSTKPSAKMRQNLSQSQEIKFGDAFEEIIKAPETRSIIFNSIPKFIDVMISKQKTRMALKLIKYFAF